jgi:pimeloyl-ACP methyl ester carboxylesterase
MLTTFDNARIFGSRYGSGPPTVLALHGWARDHSDFDAMFGGRLDGIALDLPGFGATPPPDEPWGSPEYAKAVLPVLSEMATPVVVVGHSFGGRVAVHLAQRAKADIRALVLTGVPLVGDGGAPRKPPRNVRIAKRLAALHLVSDRRLEAARQQHGSPDYRAAEGVMRPILVKLLHEDYSEALAAVRCPVELIWGMDDREVPLARAEKLVRMIPDARLTVYEDAGHLTPLTLPTELRAVVEQLLK